MNPVPDPVIFPAMRRLAPVRIVLATLLVLFSAPVVGVADALLFHGGEAKPLATAIQAPDAPAMHGDSCQLASHQGHATPEATAVFSGAHADGADAGALGPATAPTLLRYDLPSARAPPLT